MKKYIIYSLILISLLCLNSFGTTSVMIQKKDYKAANTSEVSTRELAMLASLVYEDVPNDRNYDNPSKSANLGCNLNSDGSVTGKNGGKCFYQALEKGTNPALKRDGKHVFQYVEGLSARKVDFRLVSMITAAFQEDGEKYYFLNYAKTSELNNNWDIVHYQSTDTEKTTLKDHATFSAITFKKGNNYVIAFRGTDYPDILEWMQDVAYAIDGEHAQAKLAYKYAQSEYQRILRENGNAKIYIVGHSLGAYLSQVAGAAMIDYASGRTNPEATPITGLNSIEAYGQAYNSAPNLVQVAYFNGMGVEGLFANGNFTQNIDNALVYLASYNRNGTLGGTGRTVNYSSALQSSGRLVLYSMDADPISDVGFHYGEIYKLDVGADAVANHNGTHPSLLGTGLQQAFTQGEVGDISTMFAFLLKAGLITEKLQTNFYVPEFVAGQIQQETNKDIRKYSLKSLLTNMDADLISFQAKYATEGAMIDNLFDHFNMTHETDSFACIIDKNYGVLDEKKLSMTVGSDNMPCEGNTCYSRIKYFLPKIITYSTSGVAKKVSYTLGNPITKDTVVRSKDNNYITLTTNIIGGCAKKYHWEYSADGTNFTEIGTTVNNKIAIDPKYISTERNTKKTVYFRVKADYGDNFYETKAQLRDSDVGGNPVIRYEKSSYSTNHNPTNSEDSTLGETRGNITSKTQKVSFVYDDIPPKCSFSQSRVSLKRGSTTTIRFTCSDVTSVDLNANRLKLSFVFLINGFTIEPKCYPAGKYCDIKITASKNRILTANNQTLSYNDYVTDLVGNKTASKVDSKVELERYK